MRLSVRAIPALSLLLVFGACYRLPLRVVENDASGYEDLGVPVIEAVEYTPLGRDLRVSLEAAGYVTVIIVDPNVGATVRFRRGDLRSVYSSKGLHRYPLDRLSSPMLASQVPSVARGLTRRNTSRPAAGAQPRATGFTPLSSSTDTPARATEELSLSSQRVATGSGPVTAAHVVVLVTEQPLDLVAVAMRLARSTLDPALVAQSAADVVEGGRWMAAVAKLR